MLKLYLYILGSSARSETRKLWTSCQQICVGKRATQYADAVTFLAATDPGCQRHRSGLREHKEEVGKSEFQWDNSIHHHVASIVCYH